MTKELCNPYTKNIKIFNLEIPCVNSYYTRYSSKLLELNGFSKCINISKYKFNAIPVRDLLKCKNLNVGGDWYFVKKSDACLGYWKAGVLLKVNIMDGVQWIVASLLTEGFKLSGREVKYSIDSDCLHYGYGGNILTPFGGVTAKEAVTYAMQSYDALTRNSYGFNKLLQDTMKEITEFITPDVIAHQALNSGHENQEFHNDEL